MRRYYSHYTFIYPDVYLKNCVVEMDDNRKIVRVFPYRREIEKTEFYSGLLAFIPDGEQVDWDIFSEITLWSNSAPDLFLLDKYNIWHKDSEEAYLLR